MGGVAIWSMHYIGNRGVVLFEGQSELQLSYGAGFTITSFFIPIVVLLLAYAVIGGGENPQFWRLLFGGTFAGTAICGMHYLVIPRNSKAGGNLEADSRVNFRLSIIRVRMVLAMLLDLLLLPLRPQMLHLRCSSSYVNDGMMHFGRE